MVFKAIPNGANESVGPVHFRLYRQSSAFSQESGLNAINYCITNIVEIKSCLERYECAALYDESMTLNTTVQLSQYRIQQQHVHHRTTVLNAYFDKAMMWQSLDCKIGLI